MEKLNENRFIIGIFFAIIGAFLVVLAFALSYDKGFGKSLNLYAGLAMLCFGAFMLWTKRKIS